MSGRRKESCQLGSEMDELKSIANKFEITNNNVTKGNNEAYAGGN